MVAPAGSELGNLPGLASSRCEMPSHTGQVGQVKPNTGGNSPRPTHRLCFHPMTPCRQPITPIIEHLFYLVKYPSLKTSLRPGGIMSQGLVLSCVPKV